MPRHLLSENAKKVQKVPAEKVPKTLKRCRGNLFAKKVPAEKVPRLALREKVAAAPFSPEKVPRQPFR